MQQGNKVFCAKRPCLETLNQRHQPVSAKLRLQVSQRPKAQSQRVLFPIDDQGRLPPPAVAHQIAVKVIWPALAKDISNVASPL